MGLSIVFITDKVVFTCVKAGIMFSNGYGYKK